MRLSDSKIIGLMSVGKNMIVGDSFADSEMGEALTFWIEICKIPSSSREAVVLVPGFGSGWTGMAMLGFFLARMGYEVIMVSMIGYGNSDDVLERGCLSLSSDVLANVARHVSPGKRIHWVGHSLGAQAVTELAFRKPELVASLILLAPAGFERRGLLEVAARFSLNGLLHAVAFRGNPLWKRIKAVLPKEKGPFSRDRLTQRFKEWTALCRGSQNGSRPWVMQIAHVPTLGIWGGYDFVFPKSKSVLPGSGNRNAVWKEMPFLWHNLTMLGSDKVAAEINTFIRGL